MTVKFTLDRMQLSTRFKRWYSAKAISVTPIDNNKHYEVIISFATQDEFELGCKRLFGFKPQNKAKYEIMNNDLQ